MSEKAVLHDVRASIKSISRVKPGGRITLPGTDHKRGARGSVPAPVTISGSMAPVGDAIVPTTVVPVRGLASGMDPRYQVDPDTVDWTMPIGAGFSSGRIGFDPMTGKPWGAP